MSNQIRQAAESEVLLSNHEYTVSPIERAWGILDILKKGDLAIVVPTQRLLTLDLDHNKEDFNPLKAPLDMQQRFHLLEHLIGRGALYQDNPCNSFKSLSLPSRHGNEHQYIPLTIDLTKSVLHVVQLALGSDIKRETISLERTFELAEGGSIIPENIMIEPLDNVVKLKKFLDGLLAEEGIIFYDNKDYFSVLTRADVEDRLKKYRASDSGEEEEDLF